MKHEPECVALHDEQLKIRTGACIFCGIARAAYQRGHVDGQKSADSQRLFVREIPLRDDGGWSVINPFTRDIQFFNPYQSKQLLHHIWDTGLDVVIERYMEDKNVPYCHQHARFACDHFYTTTTTTLHEEETK